MFDFNNLERGDKDSLSAGLEELGNQALVMIDEDYKLEKLEKLEPFELTKVRNNLKNIGEIAIVLGASVFTVNAVDIIATAVEDLSRIAANGGSMGPEIAWTCFRFVKLILPALAILGGGEAVLKSKDVLEYQIENDKTFG